MPYRVSLNCSAEEAEHALAELLDHLPQGVIVEDPAPGQALLLIFFEALESAECFLRQIPHLRGSVEECSPAAAAMSAVPDWQPILAGERLFLAPPWRDDPTPPGRIRLTMPQGDAYGTGMHAPTQIMLTALEGHLRPADAVLDLGTGSGILAAAARALGASRVMACDIDLEAIRSAARYLGGSAELFAGSAASLGAACVDVVAANIDQPTLLGLLREIRRLLRPGGRVLLSGFGVEESRSLEEGLGETGFRVLERFTQEEWAGLAAVTVETRHGR